MILLKTPFASQIHWNIFSSYRFLYSSIFKINIYVRLILYIQEIFTNGLRLSLGNIYSKLIVWVWREWIYSKHKEQIDW